MFKKLQTAEQFRESIVISVDDSANETEDNIEIRELTDDEEEKEVEDEMSDTDESKPVSFDYKKNPMVPVNDEIRDLNEIIGTPIRYVIKFLLIHF